MEATQTKKKLIPTNITVGRRGQPSLGDLRELARSHPEEFMRKAQGLIDEGKLRWEHITDLRALYQNFAAVQVPAEVEVMAGVRAAVMTSSFTLLTGGLTVQAINESYAAVPTIGEELVTELTDNKKVTTVAAITSMDKDTDVVEEGQPFPEIGAGEETFQIGHKRNGRRLSITAETIEENDVAGFVDKCNALGEIAGEWIEEQTLERICDKHGSNTSSAAEPYVFRPNGAGAALYSSTANTPGTRAPSGTRVDNNALVDNTDLDNARAVLAAMKNSRGKRMSVPVNQCILLVPDALVGVASKILNSELTPGVENELNSWGPRGMWRPRLLSSPKIDDISTSAWYLGLFRKQFRRKWKLKLEYLTLAGDTQKFLESRIAFQARIAWDVEIGATDYVYVVQNLSGSTYTP